MILARFVRNRWGVGVLILLLLGAGVWSRSGSAHAEYESSDPPANATLQVAPTQVVVSFSQEIASDGTVLRVLDADGTQVDLGDTTLDLFDADRKRVTLSLPPSLPAGTYTVEWTSASAEDAETDTGSFVFVVAGSATPVASPIASPVASPSPTLSSSPASGA